MIDMRDIMPTIIAKDCVELSVDLQKSYKAGFVTEEDIKDICNIVAEETIKRIKEEC